MFLLTDVVTTFSHIGMNAFIDSEHKALKQIRRCNILLLYERQINGFISYFEM